MQFRLSRRSRRRSSRKRSRPSRSSKARRRVRNVRRSIPKRASRRRSQRKRSRSPSSRRNGRVYRSSLPEFIVRETQYGVEFNGSINGVKNTFTVIQYETPTELLQVKSFIRDKKVPCRPIRVTGGNTEGHRPARILSSSRMKTTINSVHCP